jgi:23S rRNA pseudouridine1911/1915/1917 synthase
MGNKNHTLPPPLPHKERSGESLSVVYEDNHIIIVNKKSGEIVQGDKTGDPPLSDFVKQYIKEKYQKPGEVFLGVVHRLDRPVSGLVVFARTSKALSRLNKMFASKEEIKKTYWAIVETHPQPLPHREGSLCVFPKQDSHLPSLQGGAGGGSAVGGYLLTHWLTRNEQQNKSYAHDHEVPGSKKAMLRYKVMAMGDRYALLEVQLLTGRHHQIRCQLSAIGCPIRGDLKYGARRSNPDGSISLLSRSIEFVHPVSKETIITEAPLPHDPLWQTLADKA